MHTEAMTNAALKGLTFPIIGFVATGAFSFGLVCVLLLLRPEALSGDPSQHSVLALTHVISLGWVASILFAGTYLLGPILAGSPLWSQRLPVFHLVCHVSGLALMLGGFATGNLEFVGQGSAIVCLGVVSMVVNLLVTAGKRSLWTPANLGFQASFFWLIMAGGVALFMLWSAGGERNRFTPELLTALHAHYALFGFLAQALLAASLRIVPELLSIDKIPRWVNVPGWFGWVLLNAGLFFLPMVQTGATAPILTSGILIALGMLGFATQIGCYLFLRQAQMSWGAATHLTGIILLLFIVGGALWSFPLAGEDAALRLRSWMQLYISLSLLGPFAFVILGAGEKLLPHLVWHLRFAPWDGYATLPTADSLRRKGASAPMFFCLLMAVGYLFVGQINSLPVATQIGAVLLLVSFGWFIVGVSPALRHMALGVTPADLRGLDKLSFPLGNLSLQQTNTEVSGSNDEKIS